MAKKSTKKASSKPTPSEQSTKSEKKLNGLQEGSLRKKTADLMADGKKRTAEEIIKGNPGSRSPMTFLQPIFKSLKKAGIEIEEPEKGSFSLKS